MTAGIRFNPSLHIVSASTRAEALGCEVPRHQVDAGLAEATERTVRLASQSLGIDPPRVRYLPTGTRGIRGVVFDENLREVWITIQDRAAMKDTALHELRHCWQLDADRWVALDLLTMDARQRDADRFARDWRPFEELKTATGERLSHKSIRTELSIKAAGPGSFEAYASTWDVDETNERFLPGAFAASLQRRAHRPLLWSHDMSQVVGAERSLVEDQKGLRGEWAFADTAAGRDMRALVVSGAVQAMSVGFVPGQKRQAAGGVTEITEADLLECSLVSIPANPAAVVTSAKAYDAERIDIRAELARRRARSYAR